MEKYYEFNKKILRFIGIDLETPQNSRVFNLLRSAVTSIFLLLTIIQNFMVLVTFDKISIKVNNAISMYLCGVMGFVKLAAVVRHQKQLSGTKARLNQLVEELDKKKFDKVINDLKFFERLAKVLLRVSVSCSLLFSLTPGIAYIWEFIANGQATLILPYSMGYPFNEENYLLLVYIHEAISAYVWSYVPQAFNGIVILMVAQLAALFESFGEKLCEDINEASKEFPMETIGRVVKYHNELLNIGESLVRIFEVPLLVNVLCQTVLNCFIAFDMTVSYLAQF